MTIFFQTHALQKKIHDIHRLLTGQVLTGHLLSQKTSVCVKNLIGKMSITTKLGLYTKISSITTLVNIN